MRGDKMFPCRLNMASPFLYWIGGLIRYLKTGIQIYDNINLPLWSKQEILRNIFS